jgi:hypothetical protein
VQRRTHDWTSNLVLKNSLGSAQARRLKGAVCEGECYEVGDGTEDGVIYFSEEEYRSMIAISSVSGGWLKLGY